MQMIKQPMELLYKDELQALGEIDKNNKKPKGWLLSPKSIRTFILGSNEKIGKQKIQISQKFYGDDALVERCIITLASNRGLMLIGEPGTAKTMLSELLSTAISGTSTNTVQGTAGTTDDNIKYSWNYAILLAKGPVKDSLVPGPLYTGMIQGKITRFEEITRCPSEVQDTLISVMSDKVLNIPEFGEEGFVFAQPGFNIIGTANIRDKGVNEMSSALKRRFNFETVHPINSVKLEAEIITQQTSKMLQEIDEKVKIDEDIVELLATTFNELRKGLSIEGKKIESPNSIMSTAEAVSLYFQTALTSFYYEDTNTIDSLAQNIRSTVLKEKDDDLPILRSYFNTIIKERADNNNLWKAFYEARKWIK